MLPAYPNALRTGVTSLPQCHEQKVKAGDGNGRMWRRDLIGEHSRPTNQGDRRRGGIDKTAGLSEGPEPGFRTPAKYRREQAHGGRRRKSLNKYRRSAVTHPRSALRAQSGTKAQATQGFSRTLISRTNTARREERAQTIIGTRRDVASSARLVSAHRRYLGLLALMAAVKLAPVQAACIAARETRADRSRQGTRSCRRRRAAG